MNRRRNDRDKDRRRGQDAPPAARSLPQAAPGGQLARAPLAVRQMPSQGTVTLAGRIRQQPQASVQAVSGSAGSPGGTPQVMPLAQVIISPVSSDYAVLAYRGLTPLWTTDGAAVPAVSPGRWGQLHAAGQA